MPFLKALGPVCTRHGKQLAGFPVPLHGRSQDMPTRNFVSDLVIGVSTSTYRSFESRDAAEAAFSRAQGNGEVAELRGDRSYVVPPP